jgi:hypothetical protein
VLVGRGGPDLPDGEGLAGEFVQDISMGPIVGAGWVPRLRGGGLAGWASAWRTMRRWMWWRLAICRMDMPQAAFVATGSAWYGYGASDQSCCCQLPRWTMGYFHTKISSV